MTRSPLRRATALRRLALVGALVVGLLPLTSTPALADDFAPEITSFKRIGLDVLGSEHVVTIEFTARDEGPAGLTYAMFTYRTPLDAELRVDSLWMNRASEGTFLASKPLSLWAASGNYILEKVEVLDLEGNSTVYERGTATQFDFAAADFTVDNPLEDTETPTLSSVTLFQKNVTQGTPVVALYGAHDNLSGVSEVVVHGFTPTGGNFHVRSLPELGAAGPATWLVPLGAATGEYETLSVIVWDRAGNMTDYRVGEETSHYPPKATVPDHQHPDVSDLNFTVVGMTEDRTPPVMSSFSMLTSQDRRLGEIVALDFAGLDDGSGIDQVHAYWSDALGHEIYARKTCGDLTRGPLSTTIEDYRTVGSEWTLNYITLVDHLGNQVAYHRDGRVTYNQGPGTEVTHSFDLSQGDFRIEPGEPGPRELPDTTSEYVCPVIGDVGLNLDDKDVLFGDPVTTSGIVDVGDTPVPNPIVAIHQFVDGEPLLTDVVAGNAAGEYREAFVPKASGAVAATFLGADGPSGADPSTSSRVRITVRPRLTVALSRPRIRLGRKATLAGSITPAKSSVVVLRRKTRSGWKRLAETTTSSLGTFAFPIRPQRSGRFHYRVTTAAGDRLGSGRSDVLTLIVRS